MEKMNEKETLSKEDMELLQAVKKNGAQKGKNKTSVMIIAVLLLIIVGMGVGGYLYLNQEEPDPFEQEMNRITEIPEEDRQAAIDQIVEENMINVAYAAECTFEGRNSLGFIVRNIENNHHPMVFEIFDEEGESIFVSEPIEPGYEMTSVTLGKDLSQGTHQCTIRIGYEGMSNVVNTFPLTIVVK